jgi:hypothetical protein
METKKDYGNVILLFIIVFFLGVFFTTSYIRWNNAVELRDKAKASYEYNAEHPPFTPVISDDITFVSKDGRYMQFGYNLLIDWKDTTYSKLLKLEIQRHIYDIGHLHYAEEFSERKIDNITIDSKLFLQMQDTILWLGNHSLPCGLKDSDFTKLK